MRKTALVMLAMIALCLPSPSAAAAEKEVSPAFVRANLFKNGIAMITREFEADASGGDYVLKDMPAPVHGTFWIENEPKAEIRLINREQRWKSATYNMNYLQGEEVTLFLDTGDAVIGKMGSTEEFNGKKFLVIQTDDESFEFVDTASVKRIASSSRGYREVENVSNTPVLLIRIPEGKKRTVRFSYLTKGLSWAPSYELRLSDGDDGHLRMQAVIRSELDGIEKTHIYMLSGFPQIRFSHVTSPISSATSWNDFMSALAYDPSTAYRYTAPSQTQAVMSQVAVMSNLAVAPDSFRTESSAPYSLPGDSFDIHLQDAGTLSIPRNESLMLDVGSANIKYERIVEWFIPDDRDINGRYIESYNSNTTDSQKAQDDVWDTVRFKNPFDFPMTTAPISTYQDGNFLGENISYWTGPGVESSVRVTKALNIRVRHREKEIPENRREVFLLNHTWQQCTIEGTVKVRNTRAQTTTFVVKRNFSGNLLSADGKPKSELLPEGTNSVNERNQLVWEFDLAPGKEVAYNYTYEVLTY